MLLPPLSLPLPLLSLERERTGLRDKGEERDLGNGEQGVPASLYGGEGSPPLGATVGLASDRWRRGGNVASDHRGRGKGRRASGRVARRKGSTLREGDGWKRGHGFGSPGGIGSTLREGNGGGEGTGSGVII